MKYVFFTLLSILVFSCNTQKKENNSVTNSNASAKNINIKNTQTYKSGKLIYDDLCVTCHLPNGKGVEKVFPPLAQSDYLFNNRTKSIKAIKYGLSEEITVNNIKYSTPMAPLGLSDKEVANVMNYITNTWGNKNEQLITEEEVSKIEP